MRKIYFTYFAILVFFSIALFGFRMESKSQLDGFNLIRFKDIENRDIVMKKTAKRIVDLTGLGATNQVLRNFDENNTTYSPLAKAYPDFLNKGIVDVGSWSEPNIEKIIALQPDVILIGWSGKEAAARIYNQTGIQTVCIGRMDGRFDYDNYEILGKVTGNEKRAEKINSYIKEKINVISRVTDNINSEKRKKVFFWITPNVKATVRTNGIYDAIDNAGGVNVAANNRGIGLYELSKEQVMAWNPDYIFVQSSSKKGTKESFAYSTINDIKKDDVFGNINAVKREKIYYLRGPRSDWDTAIEVVEMLYIAKLIYPEEFKNLDVEKEGNEVFLEFYGRDHLYADMCDNVGMINFSKK